MTEQSPATHRIRRIQAGEETTVRNILERFKDYDAADTAPFLADPTRWLFVAGDGIETLGWAYGYELRRPDGRKAMLLYEIEVAESARGKGIARKLMETVLTLAKGRGSFELWTLTDDGNEAAKALYESAGGDPVGQVMYTWDLTRPRK